MEAITQPQAAEIAEKVECPDVYRAICRVAKAISHDGIGKGKRNEQQGYAFRGIDDFYNALSALLAGADLCILPRMVERNQQERVTQKGGVIFYVTVQAAFDLVSARDGSMHTVIMYGEAMDTADKATNKAMSAAYKYACMQVFCIPTEGMDDADKSTPEAGKPVQQQTTNSATNATNQGTQQAGKEQMELSKRIQGTAEVWLKRFMAAEKPQVFKKVLGEHGCTGIEEIPIHAAKSDLIFEDLRIAYADSIKGARR